MKLNLFRYFSIAGFAMVFQSIVNAGIFYLTAPFNFGVMIAWVPLIIGVLWGVAYIRSLVLGLSNHQAFFFGLAWIGIVAGVLPLVFGFPVSAGSQLIAAALLFFVALISTILALEATQIHVVEADTIREETLALVPDEPEEDRCAWCNTPLVDDDGNKVHTCPGCGGRN